MRAISKQKPLLKAVFSITVVVLLVVKYDWKLLWETFSTASSTWLLAAFLQAAVVHVVGVIRWKLLCRGVSLFALLRLTYIARFYSTVLPGQLFGEAAKVAYLGSSLKDDEKTGMAMEEVAASVVVDKIVGLIGLLMVGLFGGATRLDMLGHSFIWVLCACCFLLIAIIFLPASGVVETILSKTEARWPRLQKLCARLSYFLRSWKLYLKTPWRLVASLLLGVIFQLVNTLVFCWFGAAVSIDIPYADWCWINAVLSVALLLPISYAGLGVREVTMVGFLAMLGVSEPAALSCSLLFLCLQIFDAVVGGLFLLAGGKKK